MKMAKAEAEIAALCIAPGKWTREQRLKRVIALAVAALTGRGDTVAVGLSAQSLSIDLGIDEEEVVDISVKHRPS